MASANTYLQVSELDFDDIRKNLKSYLSTQTQFKDYDFEGSAMAVLLDVLAYNTHYNAYYLNMIGNEMFLDTAQQRDSVVSRAKELGYVPVSAIGASATIRLTFSGVDSSVAQFTIPKNSKFVTVIDDISYTFVTPTSYEVVKKDGAFVADIIVKEGLPLQYQWTVNSANPVRYVIPNENVDMTSLEVNVQNSSTDTKSFEYVRATNVNQVFSTSKVYFLEEAFDSKYEVIFGTGSLGKEVKNGNIIKVDYLVCNGEVTNGAKTFTVESMNVGVSYDSVTVTTVKNAAGGRPPETVDSIRFNAPRNYQTQNRAIIDQDYQRILLAENPDLQSVTSFGGEQADPPVYGKVYIAVKPFGEQFTTAARKLQLKESILDRVPLSIDPVFVDADYTYVVPTVTSYFNTTLSTLTNTEVIANVRASIKKFTEANLERFGNRLRYSRFVRELDNDGGDNILNTEVSLKIEKRFVPNTNTPERVLLKFNNELRTGSLESTQFTYDGFTAYLRDDENGNVDVFRYNEAKEIIPVVAKIGTIDYTNGTVNIENFGPSAYADIELKVTAQPVKLDITPVREQILIIDHEGASITAVGENE